MIKIVSLRMVRERGAPYGDVRISAPGDVVRLWEALLADGHPDREEVWVLCLSSRMKPTALHMVARACLEGALVTPREIVKTAIAANAVRSSGFSRAFWVLGWKNGQCPPKGGTTNKCPPEGGTTNEYRRTGEILRIELRDHVIVGDGCFHSMAGDWQWEGGECDAQSESATESDAGGKPPGRAA